MAIFGPMGTTYTVSQFFLHRFKAKRWDAFHSPYLFDLFTACCNELQAVNGAEALEKQRSEWMISNEQVKRLDLGAGAKSTSGTTSSLASIAHHSLSKPFQCRFMSRLVQWKKPSIVLELGTSLGLSAAYMALATNEVRIHTVEGDPAVAMRAEQFFQQMKLRNITLHTLPFEEFLVQIKMILPRIDVLFLDGNHTAAALQSYYHSLKNFIDEDSIVIVDDIYWSADMTKGWNDLVQQPEVTQSVDCFHFGLLFFGKNFKQKEHHTVRLPAGMLLK